MSAERERLILSADSSLATFRSPPAVDLSLCDPAFQRVCRFVTPVMHDALVQTIVGTDRLWKLPTVPIRVVRTGHHRPMTPLAPVC